MRKPLIGFLAALLTLGLGMPARAGVTLEAIREHGRLTCGVAANVAGFSRRDARGRYEGFEADLCRAVAAAILGSGDKVDFRSIDTIDNMMADPDIDIVFHGLTWTFAREMSRDIQFGPIVFYDGQAFLVKKRLGAKNMGQLLGRTICVQDNSDFLVNLQRAYREKRMVLKTVAEKTPAAAQSAFFTGRCDALTADASALATILAARGVDTDDYVILPDRISKEPLAPIMRRDDDDFADVVRWTFFALVDAEELGITAMNVDKAKVSDDPKVRAFLTEASTRAGLAAGWTAAVIANVGNYGELYERHLGQGTAAHLDRGPNDLWTRGGLMLTPPFH